MIVTFPDVAEVITPGEYLEVERMLEMLPQDHGDISHIELIRVFNADMAVNIAKGAAFALLAVAIAYILGKQVLTQTRTTQRQRRRVRCSICLSVLVGILAGAANDIKTGYAYNRALKTEDKPNSRKAVKRRSRA